MVFLRVAVVSGLAALRLGSRNFLAAAMAESSSGLRGARAGFSVALLLSGVDFGLASVLLNWRVFMAATFCGSGAGTVFFFMEADP